MKVLRTALMLFLLILASCTSTQKISYLNNVDELADQVFQMDFPDYKIQYRDILYITLKGMTSEGLITDFLTASRTSGAGNFMQNESGQAIYGYDVSRDGKILLPVLGEILVAGMTLEEARECIGKAAQGRFHEVTTECKLLSFKFTVIGEVKTPGTFINYNNYLTIFDAIGRAGGIGDFGRRDNILVIRPTEEGTKTFRLNLQNKNLLTSRGYFLLPNDVIIVEPVKHKIFNMNLPTVSFILTSVTSTVSMLILILNFVK